MNSHSSDSELNNADGDSDQSSAAPELHQSEPREHAFEPETQEDEAKTPQQLVGSSESAHTSDDLENPHLKSRPSQVIAHSNSPPESSAHVPLGPANPTSHSKGLETAYGSSSSLPEATRRTCRDIGVNTDLSCANDHEFCHRIFLTELRRRHVLAACLGATFVPLILNLMLLLNIVDGLRAYALEQQLLAVMRRGDMEMLFDEVVRRYIEPGLLLADLDSLEEEWGGDTTEEGELARLADFTGDYFAEGWSEGIARARRVLKRTPDHLYPRLRARIRELEELSCEELLANISAAIEEEEWGTIGQLE